MCSRGRLEGINAKIRRSRDYDLLVSVTADPRVGVAAVDLRYRFTHCVRATVTTTLSTEIWRRSLDDRLLDHEQGGDLDGFLWAVGWQVLYPGLELVAESAEARRWSEALGRPFHEATIETGVHAITLVFSDLTVEAVGGVGEG